MKTRCCVAAVVAVSTLISATSRAQGQPPGRGADACALVTKAEIEQALGVKLGDAKKPEDAEPRGVVQLRLLHPGGRRGGRPHPAERREVRHRLGEGRVREAGDEAALHEGLGTTAFFIDMFGMGTGLGVFRGDYDYVQVSAMLISGDPAKIAAGLEKVARLVVERWK